MHFHYRRSYQGPLRALILDWAGTTVDYGCFAPVAVFIEVFRRQGVTVTPQQARGPMGLAKRDHILTLAALPEVEAQWQSVHGRPCTQGDIDAMYRDSVPLQADSVANYATLIPGTNEVVAESRARGMKIGSCTGYSRPIMNRLLPVAEQQGYVPDAVILPDDVPAGRPLPWMIFQNLIAMQVYPLAACVKVGDTLTDIEEGLNAGVWSVGLTRSGNELGLREAEADALDPSDLRHRLLNIERRMRQAGAHDVIETIADLPAALDRIEQRVARGEQP
jgi:phosphonoacetaldehyde hydrolase